MPFRNINLRDSGECSVSKVLAAHDECSDPQHSCLKRHSCDPRCRGGRDRKIPWAHWPDNSVGLVIPQNEEKDYLAFGLQTDLHTYEHLDAYHIHKVYIHAYACIYLRTIKN